MGATTHSIDVNAPRQRVYSQWTQFEEFPRFMENVVEIRQEGPKSLFWKARIGGKYKEWQAEITEQIADEMIAWESVDGAPNKGKVTFESLGSERTRITLVMEYEPHGLLEKAGDALGIPSDRVEGDLERFRAFIEEPFPQAEDSPAPMEGTSAAITAERPPGQGHSQFYRDAGVAAPTHEQIARRAYELYLQRGAAPGGEKTDWFEAEKQLSENPVDGQ